MRIAPAPDPRKTLASLGGARLLTVLDAVGHEEPDRYRPWDDLRHRPPPGDLTHEEWWAALDVARGRLRRRLPLFAKDGRPLAYALPDEAQRLLHRIDQRCSGELRAPVVVTGDADAQHRYLVNGLMEEAIRSSQLEGATTSRRRAKEILRSGRAPRDRSELMILNNYRALEFMRGVDGPLTPEVVLALHRQLTQGTLDDPEFEGALQRPDDERIAVHDRATGEEVHFPPPAEELPARLDRLCDFANAPADDGTTFLHPVVRALLVHFQLAYDHPFDDGNGRTARALFSWQMRRNGYWLVEYLSISRILREAPAQYGRAFLLTEDDRGDTTYFLLHQLRVIDRAIDDTYAYLERKASEIRHVERLLDDSTRFNHRQVALLTDAVGNPDGRYTRASHARSHRVTVVTARADLEQLASLGLLTTRRDGRRFAYAPQPDLPDRLRALRGP